MALCGGGVGVGVGGSYMMTGNKHHSIRPVLTLSYVLHTTHTLLDVQIVNPLAEMRWIKWIRTHNGSYILDFCPLFNTF